MTKLKFKIDIFKFYNKSISYLFYIIFLYLLYIYIYIYMYIKCLKIYELNIIKKVKQDCKRACERHQSLSK